ncbi:MAG: Rieske 2Fe-2S domain-containing protein [Dokdonella sp.]|nr:Rieske 2Fe-2S domain-containing protein [Dokdonella sp.]
MNSHDNQVLTSVEPGSPMNALCKRYWMPACLSADLPEADGDPVLIRLLAENYVAFRDSQGRVGILEELCPHRRASLMLGQVRRGGIECIYHGWSFDVEGTVLGMPNCDEPSLLGRYRARAFPVREAGGFVWVYLGAPEHQPEFPMHRWMELPERHRHPRVSASHSNFVQVMEGLLDSSHLAILHQDSLPRPDGTVKVVNDTVRPASRFANAAAQRVPRIEVQETSFGLYAAALRQAAGEEAHAATEVRITAFVAPFTVYVANGNVTLMIVPVDTQTTYLYIVYWDPVKPFGEEPHRSQIEAGTGTLPEVAARYGFTRETLGRPDTASQANNWMQDRAAMRRGETFSGLPPFAMEDIACTSSMGAVSDRQELLVPADLAIVRMRRFLVEAARRVASGGTPPAFARHDLRGHVGAIFAQLETGQRWQDLLPSEEDELASA